METSENITKLAPALAKVQSESLVALKESDNPYYNSKYADITAIWECCRDHLTNNGFSVLQPVSSHPESKEPIITTMLLHESGEWIKDSMVMPFPAPTAKEQSKGILMKNDPQTIGKLITYGRRYALASMVGVTAEGEDDDGESMYDRNSSSSPDTKVVDDQKHTTRDNIVGGDSPKRILFNALKKAYGNPIPDGILNYLPDYIQFNMTESNATESQIYMAAASDTEFFIDKFEEYLSKLNHNGDNDSNDQEQSVTYKEIKNNYEPPAPEVVDKTPFDKEASIPNDFDETLKLRGELLAALPEGANVGCLKIFLNACKKSNPEEGWVPFLKKCIDNIDKFAHGLIDHVEALEMDPGFKREDISKNKSETSPKEEPVVHLDNDPQKNNGYTDLQKKFMTLSWNKFKDFLTENEQAFTNLADRTKAREKWDRMSAKLGKEEPFPFDKKPDTSIESAGVTIAKDSVPPKVRMKGFQNLYPKLTGKIQKDLGMAKTVQSDEAAMIFVNEAERRLEAYKAKHNKDYEELK